MGNYIPTPDKYFWILSKKKFQYPDEFKGRRIARTPPCFAFFKGLGMVPQTIGGLKDYFPYMVRGVVTAHIGSLGVFIAVGTYEMAKYVIDNPYYNSTLAMLMNLDKWKALPKHQQDLLHESIIELETTLPPAWGKIQNGMRKKLVGSRIKFYKLTPDVAKWYYSAAIEGAWKEAEDRVPADLVQRVKQYLRR